MFEHLRPSVPTRVVLRVHPAIRRMLLMAVIMVVLFGLRSLLISQFREKTGQETEETASQPATHDDTQNEVVSFEAYDETPDGNVQRVLAFAATLEGSPYLYGGSSPVGFDCSGLVHYVFQETLGQALPRSSEGMRSVGEEIELEEVQPGDLLLFTGSDATSTQMGHVGIVTEVGKDRLVMIHTSSSRGVITEDMYALSYYTERFRQARRPDYTR